MAIATLIAAGGLDDSRVAEACAAIAGEAEWLERGEAARIVSRLGVDEARSALRALADLDAIVLPEGFEPRLLVADMDSTMIANECIDELAAEAGVGAEVAAITERAMLGELDFAAALGERLGLLGGLPAGVIERLLERRIRPNPGARTLVATLREHGVRCVLVSGGFTAFAEPVGQRLGFDRVVANRLELADGRLTGRIEGPLVDGAAKLRLLEQERERSGAPVIAIGDGANDLPMLAAADLSIAYRAKPRVAAAADARLDHGGLDALLWALGIPRARWLSD